ncbi:hypothetical protein HPB50_018694 [Hyalomma asiaticum]|uniref:Uncharacterized protein n=1 Tax=Hyalomma asiaticum TaxID=266040 RepID=A0ACB7RXP3_HYAAI|nr:hypothetical protein HPB50_018694 [Hyalomma asiaticum]
MAVHPCATASIAVSVKRLAATACQARAEGTREPGTSGNELSGSPNNDASSNSLTAPSEKFLITHRSPGQRSRSH